MGKGGRKRRKGTSVYERNIDQLPLACPQLGTWPTTQACTCPYWESNQQPFSSQGDAQPTEPHQSGAYCVFLKVTVSKNLLTTLSGGLLYTFSTIRIEI